MKLKDLLKETLSDAKLVKYFEKHEINGVQDVEDLGIKIKGDYDMSTMSDLIYWANDNRNDFKKLQKVIKTL